jgi:chloride channel 3/4/5
MNSRSSSLSLHSRRRLPRRRSTVSSLEQGQHGAPTDPAVHSITEEIAEIKRYEDFTTIDWVQDDAREQLRRRARQREKAGFFGHDDSVTAGWRRSFWDSYEAGQAWLVIIIVGVVIGLNAAALNIITEWLSDVKLGYCTTAFYLNEQFCCWGAENGCDEWKRWTSVGLANYIVYAIFSVFCYIPSTWKGPTAVPLLD